MENIILLNRTISNWDFYSPRLREIRSPAATKDPYNCKKRDPRLILLTEYKQAAGSEWAHINANCIEKLATARVEAHNAAILLHGDSKRGSILLSKRPMRFETGDKRKWCYNIDAVVIPKCSRDLLHIFRRGKLDLQCTKNRPLIEFVYIHIWTRCMIKGYWNSPTWRGLPPGPPHGPAVCFLPAWST